MERRLAAILVADVMGYSRLMGEDEAGTLSSLKVQEGLGMRTGPLLGDVWQVFGQGLSQRTNVLDLNAAAPADDLNASVHAVERPFDELLGRYPRPKGGVLVALYVIRSIGFRIDGDWALPALLQDR